LSFDREKKTDYGQNFIWISTGDILTSQAKQTDLFLFQTTTSATEDQERLITNRWIN